MQTYWLRYRGTRFPIRRGEYILGRSPYCSIVVSNALASRQHCAVRLNADGLSIVDLGSRNGTTVNGEALQKERPLKSGDVVRVGSDAIEVVLTEGTPQHRTTSSGSRLRLDTKPRIDKQSSSPPARPSPDDHESEEDSNTSTRHQTVSLVLELVRVAAQLPDREDAVRTIQRAIDSIIEAKLNRNQAVECDDGARLAAAIREVASWSLASVHERWARDAIAALGEDA